MSKRRFEAVEDFASSSRPWKSLKVLDDRLSTLSDELILRVLHHVPVESLAVCQRVSRRLQRLANDSQLWKAAYFDRFLRPRLQRASRRRPTAPSTATHPRPPARLAGWLDEEKLVRRGRKTNWKRQYKIRNNWSKGLCNVAEIPLATPTIPPLLARLHAGTIFTADQNNGLRAWSYQGEKRLLATCGFANAACSDRPTSIAIDTQERDEGSTRIAVGFESGSFALYAYHGSHPRIEKQYGHEPSTRGITSSIAYASPYLLTMSQTNALSLYRLDQCSGGDPSAEQAVLMTSLRSHSVWPPFSLTLRLRSETILACIAYALPSLGSGWCTGVQELHISQAGEFEDSRLTSSASNHFISVLPPRTHGQTPLSDERMVQQFSRPTSLSYCHPYLLVSHADNTLTLYLVNSTEQELKITKGKRLWGHTSAVFGAQVGGRGKAVSVSSLGDEIRVWELEGAAMSKRNARNDEEDFSIQIKPERRSSIPARLADLSRALSERDSGLGPGLEHVRSESSITKGWVGFDDESVVVMREQAEGMQALAVYDFT